MLLVTEFPLWVKIVAFIPGTIILCYLTIVIYTGSGKVDDDDEK
jgi:hypothetical protein